MTHWIDSSPTGVQAMLHAPSPQAGVEQLAPDRSHWKLQLVPEQVMTQSWRPVHPERQTW